MILKTAAFLFLATIVFSHSCVHDLLEIDLSFIDGTDASSMASTEIYNYMRIYADYSRKQKYISSVNFLRFG